MPDKAEEKATHPKSPGWILLRQALVDQKAGLFVGMLLALGWTAARILVPRFIQLGIDRGIQGDDPLWLWATLIVLAGVVSGVFLGFRRMAAFRNARLIEARYRDRLFAHIQRLHMAYHDETATGELMSRANTDLQMFQNVVTMVPITTGNVLIVIGVVIIMMWTNPVLALLALVGLPAVSILGRRFSSRLHPSLLGIQRESAELAGVVEESITGIRAVKGFGSAPVQSAKLAVEADDVFNESMDAAYVRANYLPAIELMPNLGLVVVLAYGGHLVINGTISVGELVGFNLYVLMLIQPLRMLGTVVAQGQRAIAAGERISEVLSTAPAITDPPRPKSLPKRSGGGSVSFEQVVFSYGSAGSTTVPVLDGITFHIEPGESVAFVGATGCGKSTVAHLVPRFYDAVAGSIKLDGIDVRQLRRQELRRAVSIVFEDTFLFSGTIRDNISFANPDAKLTEVRQAAMRAGALDFIEELELGFDTPLGGRGLSLSGGQRQRIAIARAVLADPRVLILDDATSAVDPSKEHEIRGAMAEVMDGRTTIVIAHRPATIALADRVVLLDEGRIVATGDHAELLATNERYRSILATGTEPELDPDAVAVDGGDR
ncbi:MAG: ABC transporter ATP-binding protein [Acidimicrobiales bacterium]